MKNTQPTHRPEPTRLAPIPVHPDDITDHTRRVAANTALHVQVRAGLDITGLDDRMADHGWPGAHHMATTDQAVTIDTDPVRALHDLLEGRRNLVARETQALADALGIPLEHLTRQPHRDRASRPGVLDRLLNRWKHTGRRSAR